MGSGNHLWVGSETWDPEGLFSTFPAVATALLGILAGRWIATQRSLAERLNGLFAAGALAMMVGLMWNWSFPINKGIWTSSYVVFTAGMAAVSLATIMWIVDLHRVSGWTKPFVIYGMNPILAYVGSRYMARIIYSIVTVRLDGQIVPLETAIYRGGVRLVAGAEKRLGGLCRERRPVMVCHRVRALSKTDLPQGMSAANARRMPKHCCQSGTVSGASVPPGTIVALRRRMREIRNARAGVIGSFLVVAVATVASGQASSTQQSKVSSAHSGVTAKTAGKRQGPSSTAWGSPDIAGAAGAHLSNALTSHTKRGRWGAIVVSLNHGDTLFSSNPDTQMSPASTMKVFTSCVALDRFGPDYVFRTPVLREGTLTPDGVLQGNLYLKGVGDPSLSPRFWKTDKPMDVLAREVVAAGVRHVHGDVVGDASGVRRPAHPGRLEEELSRGFVRRRVSALAGREPCLGGR